MAASSSGSSCWESQTDGIDDDADYDEEEDEEEDDYDEEDDDEEDEEDEYEYEYEYEKRRIHEDKSSKINLCGMIPCKRMPLWVAPLNAKDEGGRLGLGGACLHLHSCGHAQSRHHRLGPREGRRDMSDDLGSRDLGGSSFMALRSAVFVGLKFLEVTGCT